MDTRKSWDYRGWTVSPITGGVRYFGCPHGEYLTRWWRAENRPRDIMEFVLAGTKADARHAIDRIVDDY